MVVDIPIPPAIQNELLDKRIEKTKQLFYQELTRKKRNIKRQWMEINAVTNNHFLQQLPYRAMLNHIQDLTLERRAQRDEQQIENQSKNATENVMELEDRPRTLSSEFSQVQMRLVLEDEFQRLPTASSSASTVQCENPN